MFDTNKQRRMKIDEYINALWSKLTLTQRRSMDNHLHNEASIALNELEDGLLPVDMFDLSSKDALLQIKKIEEDVFLHVSFALSTGQILVMEYISCNYPSTEVMLRNSFEEYWESIKSVSWIVGVDDESIERLRVSLQEQCK